MSPDELLLDTGAGDHRAFAKLYDHSAGLVYANIRRVLHDTTRTDTVAEEVFIEVWRQAARFDPNRLGAVTWIIELAHQLAAERAEHHDAGPSLTAGPDQTRDQQSEPVPSRNGQTVSLAFAGLTQPQQRAIELASLDGSTQDEIAAQLRTSIATVQTLLRDGLLYLHAALPAPGPRTDTNRMPPTADA